MTTDTLVSVLLEKLSQARLQWWRELPLLILLNELLGGHLCCR